MRTVITPDRKAVVLAGDGTWTYASSPGSVLERWKSLTVPPQVVELFRGAFERLGFRIVDTGEAFTCLHRGDRVEFAAGLDPAAVDLTVEIYAYQADRLGAQLAGGDVDELERFRIVREMLAGASAKFGAVDNPLSSRPSLRRLIRAKNLIHVYLTSPDPAQEPDSTFTIIHVNRRSLLVPGLHGTPERVFRLRVADALELQRVLAQGLKGGGVTKWLKIAKWYVAWRKKVQVRT